MKTIDKAAKDFSEDIRENSLSGNNAGKEQYKAGRKIGFKAGVEFVQRWIPVVSDSFKVRSIELVIDAEKIEFDEVCFVVKTQQQTVEFTLSKEQAKLLKMWL